MAHMKAKNVPFHLLYSSLSCFKGLQSDGTKCRGMLVEAGASQAKTGSKTKENNSTGETRKQGLPQLSVCHLAVSKS